MTETTTTFAPGSVEALLAELRAAGLHLICPNGDVRGFSMMTLGCAPDAETNGRLYAVPAGVSFAEWVCQFASDGNISVDCSLFVQLAVAYRNFCLGSRVVTFIIADTDITAGRLNICLAGAAGYISVDKSPLTLRPGLIFGSYQGQWVIIPDGNVTKDTPLWGMTDDGPARLTIEGFVRTLQTGIRKRMDDNGAARDIIRTLANMGALNDWVLSVPTPVETKRLLWCSVPFGFDPGCGHHLRQDLGAGSSTASGSGHGFIALGMKPVPLYCDDGLHPIMSRPTLLPTPSETSPPLPRRGTFGVRPKRIRASKCGLRPKASSTKGLMSKAFRDGTCPQTCIRVVAAPVLPKMNLGPKLGRRAPKARRGKYSLSSRPHFQRR